MNKIGYVVLNYNNWSDTLKCIKSLKNIIHSNEYIYVVDNGSTIVPPLEYNSAFDPNFMRHIQSTLNNGYSSGNNHGIRLAINEGCDYIIICNNDLIFDKPISSALINYAQCHHDLGVIAPKVIGPNGFPQEINTALPLTLINKYKYLLKDTIFLYFVKNFIEKNNAIKYQFDVPLNLYSVSGCCFMMTKKSLDYIYPLDEDFFLYMEEQIIGIKLSSSNLRAVILPHCSVIHMHGKSTIQVAAFSFSCLIESEILFFRKYKNSKLIYLLPLIFIRLCQYLYRSAGNADYRKNLGVLFGKIFYAVGKKYA